MDKCLLVLARFPVSGRVKSRLAATIGSERAAAVQKGMLLDLLNRFLRVKDIVVKVVYPKDERSGPFRALCRQYSIPRTRLRFLRGVGDMNADIVYSYRSTLKQFLKVALTGADFPHYSEDQLEELWSALNDFDAVYHPNEDDGCCPHGLRKFSDMWTGNDSRMPGYITRWEQKAVNQGLSCKALSPTFDVDRLEDLQQVKRQFANLCPYTLAEWNG